MEEQIIQDMIERTVTDMLQDDLQTLIAYAEQITIGLQFIMGVIALFLFFLVINFVYKLFKFMLGG